MRPEDQVEVGEEHNQKFCEDQGRHHRQRNRIQGEKNGVSRVKKCI